MRSFSLTLRLFFSLTLASMFIACGGGGSNSTGNGGDIPGKETTYSIGGSVSGLASGASVVIQNNGSDVLTVNSNGTFTFNTQVPYSGQYALTISSQPAGQICSIANGTGSGSGVVTNINNISITCSSDIYTIGGSLTGLASGEQITLQNNGANPLTLSNNGAFTFSTPLANNGSYSVTIANQPSGQVCSVANGSGSGAGVTANVNNISITCSFSSYSIGGNVSGLADGAQVTIENNGANSLTLTNGPFAFTTLTAYNGSYAVTINSQPNAQICSIAGGTGSGSGVIANVRNVSIICSTDTYSISGSVSGLAAGAQVTLQNNGASPLTLTSNGTFSFATPIAYNGSYLITVSSQPIGETCSVSGNTGAGAAVTGNVNTINIVCSSNTFSVGGNLSGLAGGTQLTLQNNGANALTLNSSGAFTFASQTPYNASYSVSISSQPTNQICTINNGTGSAVTGNISNIAISCAPTTVAGVALTVPTTRTALAWPFSQTSIWNTPIGSGAIYVPAQLSAFSGGGWISMPDIDHEIIILRPTAPLLPIYYSSVGWLGGDRCYDPTSSVTIVQSVPVPIDFVVPNSGGNNAAAILASDGRTILQNQPFTRCTANSPATAELSFPAVDLYGDGATGSHGGSGLSAIGGSIRFGELRPGAQAPRHALKIEVDSTVFLHSCVSSNTPCFRWPALGADSWAKNATTGYGYLSPTPQNIPAGMQMGALLAIPKSVDLTNIGLETIPAQMLAWTLQNYGAYLVDSTGVGGGLSLNAEDGPDGSVMDQFQIDWGYAMRDWVIHATTPANSSTPTNPWVRDMQRLIVLLNIVDNNTVSTPGGGGVPLQPLAPVLTVPN